MTISSSVGWTISPTFDGNAVQPTIIVMATSANLLDAPDTDLVFLYAAGEPQLRCLVHLVHQATNT
jgi:hypothetical protein